MPRESLGEFEHQVLLAILRLGSESYTVPIVLELEDRTGKSPAPAAVYIALRRLEKRGLLRSRISKSTSDDGARPRRYFKVTAKAMKRLRESRHAMERLWDGLETVLQEQG